MFGFGTVMVVMVGVGVRVGSKSCHFFFSLLFDVFCVYVWGW